MPIVKKPNKPITSLKRIGKGPFRGPTPDKVIQTLDVGSRDAEERLTKQANKFKKRRYVGVDPIAVQFNTENLELKISTATQTLREYIKKGIKVRNINIDFPNIIQNYEFATIFDLLKYVLLPNGKVYITSERQHLIKLLNYMALKRGLATKYGLKYSQKDFERVRHGKNRITLRDRPLLNSRPMTLYQNYFLVNQKLNPYILEITYPLKKAYPGNSLEAKEQRRNWPRV